jgi:hypothetical protein
MATNNQSSNRKGKARMTVQDDHYYDSNKPVVVNAELQELYNKFKAAELEKLLKSSVEDGAPGPSYSRSRPTESSSSSFLTLPSLAGESFDGVTAITNMTSVIDFDTASNASKKKGRKRGLSPRRHAKANLLRKIGACHICRKKKVSVSYMVTAPVIIY